VHIPTSAWITANEEKENCYSSISLCSLFLDMGQFVSCSLESHPCSSRTLQITFFIIVLMACDDSLCSFLVLHF